ncbi:MAG TPA: rhodanese-like domain-containing protein [Acidimicrobiales bacterium]|jgi:rhodanese-related sulfurtransferase
MTAVDKLLSDARQQLDRVNAQQAKQIFHDGGLLIDIRPAAQRATFGEIPGALIIERNNLEWRLDPEGSHRIPEAVDPQRPIVVFCQEGYASSLAALSLVQLGRLNSTDLDGGFVAWQAAGYPTSHGDASPPLP